VTGCMGVQPRFAAGYARLRVCVGAFAFAWVWVCGCGGVWPRSGDGVLGCVVALGPWEPCVGAVGAVFVRVSV
jgi:hypothetical protein